MKFRTLILSLILLFTFASAQEEVDSSKVFGTHSIQFRVRGLFSFSSFEGGAISYKYHTSDYTAYRIGITLNARIWDEEITHQYTSVSTSLFEQNRDNKTMNIALIGERLWYFNTKNDIKMFFGAGLRIATIISSFDTEDVNTIDSLNTVYYDKEYKNNHYAFGAKFSYGIEWFFMKNMSLHAEYGLSVSYFIEEYSRVMLKTSDENYLDSYKNDRSGFEINDTGVLLGLSVYF